MKGKLSEKVAIKKQGRAVMRSYVTPRFSFRRGMSLNENFSADAGCLCEWDLDQDLPGALGDVHLPAGPRHRPGLLPRAVRPLRPRRGQRLPRRPGQDGQGGQQRTGCPGVCSKLEVRACSHANLDCANSLPVISKNDQSDVWLI